MTVNRRDFMRGGLGGAAAAAACATLGASPAEARENKTVAENAIGLLYDSTLCIGCKACMSACKTTNELPLDDNIGGGLWDTPFELSGKTYTVIKMYQDGTALNKDQVKDGFAHIKRQCLHCIDPSCVSVCPVKAMTRIRRRGSSPTMRTPASAAATASRRAHSTCRNSSTTRPSRASPSASSARRNWPRAIFPLAPRCARRAPRSSAATRL